MCRRCVNRDENGMSAGRSPKPQGYPVPREQVIVAPDDVIEAFRRRHNTVRGVPIPPELLTPLPLTFYRDGATFGPHSWTEEEAKPPSLKSDVQRLADDLLSQEREAETQLMGSEAEDVYPSLWWPVLAGLLFIAAIVGLALLFGGRT